MRTTPLTFIATTDLAAQTRGRSIPGPPSVDALRSGVGWVPADLALTAFGSIADNPFGPAGDLRLLPDPSTRTELPERAGVPALELYLADLALPDGTPWANCPRTFARRALAQLADKTGLGVTASFEHEFTLDGLPHSHPFSLQRFRDAEPFGSHLVTVLEQMGLEPENWLPEYGRAQFEVTLRPTTALQAADRAIVLREVVRDLARRSGLRASFAPLADPDATGNGVHVHMSLHDEAGAPVLFDPSRPGRLSDIGARFCAGILDHSHALIALTAPGPTSLLRLQPHRWSCQGAFLAEQNREALLRICPTTAMGAADPADQYNLEFRAADATGNPWLIVGALVLAGLQGILEGSPRPTVWPAGVTVDEDDVPSLPTTTADALRALEADDLVATGFPAQLVQTHCAVIRAELDQISALDPAEQCRRVADVY